jgi:hypothetical protein
LSADTAEAVPARVANALDLSNFCLADVRDGRGLDGVWCVGAGVSNILAGWIVVVAGYPAAFNSLGIIAAAGLALYPAAMSDTGPEAAGKVG